MAPPSRKAAATVVASDNEMYDSTNRMTDGGDKKLVKRNHKKDPNDFRRAIFKIFKAQTIDNPHKMSKHSLAVLNSILIDLMHRIGEEAGRLCKYTNREIMNVRDLRAALRLVLPQGEVCGYSVEEGTNKVKLYSELLPKRNNNSEKPTGRRVAPAAAADDDDEEEEEEEEEDEEVDV